MLAELVLASAVAQRWASRVEVGRVRSRRASTKHRQHLWLGLQVAQQSAAKLSGLPCSSVCSDAARVKDPVYQAGKGRR